MKRNEQPTCGATLESVRLILNAWHPNAANRMFQKNQGKSLDRVRIMAAGAIFYIGAASVTMTGVLLHNSFRPGVRRLLMLYEDTPQLIIDPWEYAVRRLAYVVRDEPDTELHKKCAREFWRSLPVVVKWTLDPEWRQKLPVTAAMIAKLREVVASSKVFEPGAQCRICRKLYRARLLSRLVRHTRMRKVPIIRYRITPRGCSLLKELDAVKSQRSSSHDSPRNRPDTSAPN